MSTFDYFHERKMAQSFRTWRCDLLRPVDDHREVVVAAVAAVAAEVGVASIDGVEETCERQLRISSTISPYLEPGFVRSSAVLTPLPMLARK